MHRLELRMSSEGGDIGNTFEVSTEALKDGKYVETAPKREIVGDVSPLVFMLEPYERVTIMAKVPMGELVFDKDQNANLRVNRAPPETLKKPEVALAPKPPGVPIPVKAET